MVAIVGTVPDENFPLVAGEVSLKGDRICIQNESVPVNRGTPALLAAAIKQAKCQDNLCRSDFWWEIQDGAPGADGFMNIWKSVCATLNLKPLRFIICNRMWIGITVFCSPFRR